MSGTDAARTAIRPGAAARAYNDRTKYRFVTGPDGALDVVAGTPPDAFPALGAQDPANDPGRFKIYQGVETIALPKEPIASSLTALDTLTASGREPDGTVIPDLTVLGRVLQRSSGILKMGTHRTGKEIAYRAAGQTGARYHLELYLVTGGLPGLAAGVYHYGPHDDTLSILRTGDYRGFVTQAAGNDPAIAQAPAILIVTSQIWRNAWRYLEHSYKQVFWDMGTLLTNTLAMAASAELPAEVVFGFADPEIARLLGIDGRDELVSGMMALGRSSEPQPEAPQITPLSLVQTPAAADSPRFPVIEAAYKGTSLSTSQTAAAWRADAADGPLPPPTKPPAGPAIPLRPASSSDRSLEDVIERRRSNRHYQAETPLSFEDFSTVLSIANGAPPLDVPFPPADVYLIVNNVEGLEPGAYFFDRTQNTVTLMRSGNLRDTARRLAMDQQYAADAQVVMFSMGNLDEIFARYGDRGYRIALFEAAVFCSRMQLAAHALGLGAVGSGSPDDELTAFFSPHAAGKDYLFVAVFGVKRKPSDGEHAAALRFLDDRRA
ncbi:MAG TPA: SagB/ThcOx family dehydrogenase [Thermomicrobiales bacterium]|nr:SagB/ThcOx family dehydrogenase [Thermomicrobiales bacterium]